jgi:hypothetical protein
MRRIQNKTADAERKAGNMADGHDRVRSKAEYPKGGKPEGHIFILRLWEEQEGSGAWVGRVQHVLRGDARSFSDLETLAECLTAMLPHHTGENTGQPGTAGAPLPGAMNAPGGITVVAPEPPYATKTRLEEKGENEC